MGARSLSSLLLAVLIDLIPSLYLSIKLSSHNDEAHTVELLGVSAFMTLLLCK